MELFEIGLQSLQDRNRVLNAGLLQINLLEPPDQSTVLFEVLAVFLVGGRPDAAQRSVL